jgi:hypothetical protein
MAMGPSTVGPNQEQGQTNTDQVAESNDNVFEEIQGNPQDVGGNMYTSAVNVETTTSATRSSPSMRIQREWSEQLGDSSKKYR